MISRNGTGRVLVFVLASALVWAQAPGKKDSTKSSQKTSAPADSTKSAAPPRKAAPPPAAGQPQYLGCYFERFGLMGRILDGPTFRSPSMTNAACQTFCAQKGFAYAGTQAGTVCACGNKAPTAEKLPEKSCPIACAGAAAGKPENCGGGGQSSIYKSK